MTPKEKAEELVDKFLYTENDYMEYADKTQSKQCALIAVDEIIAWELQCFGDVNKDSNECGAIEYWQEVKQEIEKI